MPLSMNINYGDMNPYRELPNAVATGLGLGLQAKRLSMQEQKEQTPNITIPDPGKRQQVQPEQVLQAEMSDLNTYSKYYEKAKKLDPEQKKWIFDDLRKSGVIKTELGQAMTGLVGSNEEIDPKEIAAVFKSVKAKSPTADADIKLLVAKAGGENSVLGQAIQAKSVEMANVQKQLDEEYDLKLKDTLSFVLDFQNDPRKYSNKGITPDQVKKMVDASPDQLVELWKNPANREWVNDWLSIKQSIIRRSGGGNLREKSFATYDKEGTRQVFSAMDVDDARAIAKQKGWDISKIRDMGKEGDYISDIVQGGIVKTQNLPKVKAGDGWTDKSGKAITEVIADGKHEFKDRDGAVWTVTKDEKGTKYNRVK